MDRPLRLRAGLLKYYGADIAGTCSACAVRTGLTRVGTATRVRGELANNVPPAIDQPLRWKARWWAITHGLRREGEAVEPDIRSFTSIDEFVFHEKNTTLWGGPTRRPTLLDPAGTSCDVDCLSRPLSLVQRLWRR